MMPLGSPRFWVRVRSIVEREHGEVTEAQIREKSIDPKTGAKKSERVRKVNLDMDAAGRDEADQDNVVPSRPAVLPVDTPSPPVTTPSVAAPVEPTDSGFVELDEPEMVAEEHGTETDSPPDIDIDVQPLGDVVQPFMGETPLVPAFTPRHPGSTIKPIKCPVFGQGGAQ